MNKTNKIVLIIMLLVIPVTSYALISLKTWTTNEILTAADLNAEFVKVDNALDDLVDSLAVIEVAIRDTTIQIMADSSITTNA